MDTSQVTNEIEGSMRRIETYAHKRRMTKAEKQKLQTILNKIWDLADAMSKTRDIPGP